MHDNRQIDFPKGNKLKTLLDLDHDTGLEDLFSKVLTEPIENFFARPKKSIRSDLINLGFALTGKPEPDDELKRKLHEILEVLHAGSLIIDDIEDNSQIRRGEPSLHLQYGLSIALNTGNWLYFLPFKLIDELSLEKPLRQKLAEECQKTLLLAHYGQALDVGISVESLKQERVHDVVLSSIELKSGVLAAFSFQVAFIASGITEVPREISRLGRRLGSALQMFDDIGNFASKKNPAKQYEDLKLRRLCFVMATAASELSKEEYEEFWNCTHTLKGFEVMVQTLQNKNIPIIAAEKAHSYLSKIEQGLIKENISPQGLLLFKEIQNKLAGAYV